MPKTEADLPLTSILRRRSCKIVAGVSSPAAVAGTTPKAAVAKAEAITARRLNDIDTPFALLTCPNNIGLAGINLKDQVDGEHYSVLAVLGLRQFAAWRRLKYSTPIANWDVRRAQREGRKKAVLCS